MLVLFWAKWCRRSEHIRVFVNELSKEMTVGIVDESIDPELAEQEYIRIFPALVLYEDGKSVRTLFSPSSREQAAAFVAGTQDKTETVRQKQALFRAMMMRKTKRWFHEAENMRPIAGMKQIVERNIAWVTELMRDEPVMFHTYLEDCIKPDVDRGRYDLISGLFLHAAVPHGFTVKDYYDWMDKELTELVE